MAKTKDETTQKEEKKLTAVERLKEIEKERLGLFQAVAEEIKPQIEALKTKKAEAIAKIDGDLQGLYQIYQQATGQPHPDTVQIDTNKKKGSRIRLTDEQVDALKAKILNVPALKEGAKLADISTAIGFDVSPKLRKMITEMIWAKVIRKTGDKAATLYLLPK